MNPNPSSNFDKFARSPCLFEVDATIFPGRLGRGETSDQLDFELLECAVKQVDNGVRAWGG